jgi:hypothetical protein
MIVNFLAAAACCAAVLQRLYPVPRAGQSDHRAWGIETNHRVDTMIAAFKAARIGFIGCIRSTKKPVRCGIETRPVKRTRVRLP